MQEFETFIIRRVHIDEGGQTTGVSPWVSHLKCGIEDPDNRLHGSITWHEPWGANVFPIVGAKNFTVQRFGAVKKTNVGQGYER